VNWMNDNRGDEKDFISFLDISNKFLKQVTDMRNHQEHPHDHMKLDIFDFRLLPHNKYSFPTWGLTGQTETLIHLDMPVIIDYLIEFFENLMFYSILINLGSSFPYIVIEITEERREANCPIRYRLEIDQAKLFGKSKKTD
jgi:hypothetical protein